MMRAGRALALFAFVGGITTMTALAQPKKQGPPLALPDRGVFGDLDEKIRHGIPPWIDQSQISLAVDKHRRVLTLLFRGDPVKSYAVALGFDPVHDKQQLGDGRTPEGRFYITEVRSGPDLAPRYGAVSLKLSYPNDEDARRGFEEGLITQAQRDTILDAITAGRQPPQRTRLGGSIRIHGGGIGSNWTLGCVALRDEDILELLPYVKKGTPVEVQGKGDPAALRDTDGDGIPDAVDVLLGAKKAAQNGADYKNRYVRLGYPGGDVPRRQGVCSDVVVRALRNAGIDLQAAIQKDAARAPQAYRHIHKPDPNIDHRRVRNQVPWFRRHWVPVEDPRQLLPGDVVFLDTFPSKPGADHVGIVSDARGRSGLPLLVNNWTNGYTTREMDLLSWVPITAVYRSPR